MSTLAETLQRHIAANSAAFTKDIGGGLTITNFDVLPPVRITQDWTQSATGVLTPRALDLLHRYTNDEKSPDELATLLQQMNHPFTTAASISELVLHGDRLKAFQLTCAIGGKDPVGTAAMLNAYFEPAFIHELLKNPSEWETSD